MKRVLTIQDISYMLYALTQEQVAATMMPIGNLTKSEVRSLAREAGFTVAEKPDSQELCFISEGSYADYIEKQGIAAVWGPGNFIDEDGHVLGLHKGIIHYTVGQRKGLGLSLGYPAYVKEIRNSGNEVVIGREHDLYTRTVICEDINLMSIASLKEKMRCTVKIRYQHAGQEAVIESAGDNCVRICFDDPVRAAAPGQAAVFYDQDDFVEMDTVLSARGSLKCILTIYFPSTELLVGRLLQRCTPGAVRMALDQIQNALGDYIEFSLLMPNILTDCGGEFGDPDALETDKDGNICTKIFYCDPMRSNQKAGIENVHTMLRMIIPKGTVFTDLTQWDVRKAVDHVNNAPRKKLDGKTPYEMAHWLYGKRVLEKLQLRYVAPDEVTLTPKLLKK